MANPVDQGRKLMTTDPHYPCASLSLDLDNKWSYLKTHGDPGWDQFPSYLEIVIPRILEFLAERKLTITFFVVGQDAALEKNHSALRLLADAGHEIGNHSYHHQPWLHLYTRKQLLDELRMAQTQIEAATGQLPVGFRGPGFSCSETTLRVLAELGFEYDGSIFPTFLGPVARAYYFMTAKLNAAQRQERKQLFGKFTDGFRPLRPFTWNSLELNLLEIPVTTMPVFRLPIHLSYVLFLEQHSRMMALSYFRFALLMCKLMRVEPSILLHPLDFMGCDDDSELSFFPAMRLPSSRKMALAGRLFEMLGRQYSLVSMIEHVRHVRRQSEKDPPVTAAKSSAAL